MTAQCTYCNMALPDGWHVRCRRCGAVHIGGDVISPRMVPLDAGVSRVSPWMMPYARPLVGGVYEVRFRGIGERVLRLVWDEDLLEFTHGGRIVCSSDLLTWRGAWE